MLRRLTLTFTCLLLLACTPVADETANTADLILIGDHIITMDESEVGAVAVIGDRIVATGTADDILEMRGWKSCNAATGSIDPISQQ